MKLNKKQILVSAAVAGLVGLMAQSNISAQGMGMDAKGGASGECHGVNSCKGTGDCGGKGHSCAGKNTCKGQGWKKMSKEECDKAAAQGNAAKSFVPSK